MTSLYGLLADLVLVTHFAFVAFIVAGFALIVIGGLCGWSWVRNSWFRVLHLAGILFVAAQSWINMICPLTTLEMWLRSKSDGATYEESFIQYWVGQALYYDAPAWVFVVAYSLFGLLVLIACFVYPPNFVRRGNALDT